MLAPSHRDLGQRGSLSHILDDDDSGEMSALKQRLADRLSLLRLQIATLKERIEGVLRAKEEDIDWSNMGAPADEYGFSVRRVLTGHMADCYALGWSGDNVTLASAAIDGRIILWDTITRIKKGLVTLASPWIMTTAFEQRTNELLVSGGIDANLSIFRTRDILRAPPSLEPTPVHKLLTGHDGYVTSARFLSNERIVSGSGDGSAAVWDLMLNERIANYRDHKVDVTGVSVHPQDCAVFATSSSDRTLKIWDSRGKENNACVMTLTGFLGDATAVEFFNSGNFIAGTSTDSTLRIFDLRTSQPIGIYTDERINTAAHALAISKSGRLVFVAYESPELVAWQVTSSDGTFHELVAHSDHVKAVALNSAGEAIATTGFDQRVVIWC